MRSPPNHEKTKTTTRVYKAVSIVLTGDIGKKYIELDTESLQKKLNKEVCRTIVKTAHGAFDKHLDKSQQAWIENDAKVFPQTPLTKHHQLKERELYGNILVFSFIMLKTDSSLLR